MQICLIIKRLDLDSSYLLTHFFTRKLDLFNCNKNIPANSNPNPDLNTNFNFNPDLNTNFKSYLITTA